MLQSQQDSLIGVAMRADVTPGIMSFIVYVPGDVSLHTPRGIAQL